MDKTRQNRAESDCAGPPLPVKTSHGSATIIDEIITRIRKDLTESRKSTPLERLQELARGLPPGLSLESALTPDETDSPRVIAELKKASPSRGIIREDFEAMDLARELVKNGAAALSILTEVHYFRGSPRYLQTVADEVSVPVLRKDFIVDPYQVYEARLWGADAVLLIASALSGGEFRGLLHLATLLGLDVLAEVHNETELDMVLEAGAGIVGVNSRDLRTFKTDLKVTESLVSRIPDDVIAVAESGIKTADDIAGLRGCGVNAFLIGETLMSAPSPGRALAELLSS